MSRAYRIQLSRRVSKVVHLEDSVKVPIEFLPILDRPRMADLLALDLRERGFEVEGDVATHTMEDGVVLRVVLSQSIAELVLHQEAQVEQEIEAVTHGDTDNSTETAARAYLEKSLDQRENIVIAQKTTQIQGEVTSRLEGKLPEAQALLDDITGSVTRKALRERAASMGTLEEANESPDGSLRLKIRL